MRLEILLWTIGFAKSKEFFRALAVGFDRRRPRFGLASPIRPWAGCVRMLTMAMCARRLPEREMGAALGMRPVLAMCRLFGGLPQQDSTLRSLPLLRYPHRLHTELGGRLRKCAPIRSSGSRPARVRILLTLTYSLSLGMWSLSPRPVGRLSSPLSSRSAAYISYLASRTHMQQRSSRYRRHRRHAVGSRVAFVFVVSLATGGIYIYIWWVPY